MPDLTPTPPLTTLSEEEELFRRTVRDFAERAVRPRVAAMERAAALDPALLTQCFELGLMVRQAGDAIAMSPPLVIEKAQIDEIIDITAKTLKAVA